jgi:hypothetical protein
MNGNGLLKTEGTPIPVPTAAPFKGGGAEWDSGLTRLQMIVACNSGGFVKALMWTCSPSQTNEHL